MAPAGSVVCNSVQHSVFGSVTASRPLVSPGCQTAKFAPDGSANWAIRPAVNTSMGAARTVPPAWVTASAAASASGVLKYSVQAGAAPGSPMGPTAPTVLPPVVNMP